MSENEPPEYPAYGSMPEQGSTPASPPPPEPTQAEQTQPQPTQPQPTQPQPTQPPPPPEQAPAGYGAGAPPPYQQPPGGWQQPPPPGWPQYQPQSPYAHPPGPPYYAPPPSSQKALWSMILGISALATIPLCAGLFGLAVVASIAAIIMGVQAKGEIARSQGAISGAGQAQAGFITGIIGTVLLGIGLVFFIAVFASI